MMDIARSTPPAQTRPRPPAAPASRKHWLRQLGPLDWLYALALAAGAGFALAYYQHAMDAFDDIILVLHVPVLAAIGWHWKTPSAAFWLRSPRCRWRA